MSSATKALELLSYFSTAQPEIGLSQLCRLAGRDKATTFRHLQSLETAGFVEQDDGSKRYRLGPALLHLAQVREETVPRKQGAEAAVAALAKTTGETAHASVLSGTTLYSLISCEPTRHAIRAVIDITTHPLHATASGMCSLAYGPETLMTIVFDKLERFTDETPTTPEELISAIEQVRRTGFGRGERSYEDEILGISTPIFDQSKQFAGTVSVASVAARFTPDLENTIKTQLVLASREITHNWGGTIPAEIEATWAQTLLPLKEMERAS